MFVCKSEKEREGGGGVPEGVREKESILNSL